MITAADTAGGAPPKVGWKRILVGAVLLLASCSQRAPDTAAATFQLDVDKCRGLNHQVATAVLIGPGIAATVAHSFVDDGEVSVEEIAIVSSEGRDMGPVEIVYLDPLQDVALISFDSGNTEPLEVATHDPDDPSVRMVHFNPEGTAASVPLEVLRITEATLDGQGRRRVLEVAGSIETGDSGAAVLSDDGQVIGIVFATSKTDARGWAIASSEFEAAMAQTGEPLIVGCS